MTGFDRGVYHEPSLNGQVEYKVYSSARKCIVIAFVDAEFAGKEAEEAMAVWLDLLDPEGSVISPAAPGPSSLPLSSSLAA